MGDDTFLASPTSKTKAVWSRCEELLKEESARGGCLDVETKILSGITAFAPGYIDKDNEVIVGLQTDAPLKRIINMYGGTKVAMKALEAHGHKINDEVYKYLQHIAKLIMMVCLMHILLQFVGLVVMDCLQVYLTDMVEVVLLVTIAVLHCMVSTD